MAKEAKGALALAYNRLAIPLGLGLIGYAINCLPVEVFPGIHFIFGSVITIAAAAKFGPAAGALSGAVSGLRASALWSQPLVFGPVLYGLEGLCVGYLMRGWRRGPVVATLAYWVLLGGWLSLAALHFISGLPLRFALILQSRSIINGIVAGLLAEVGILGLEVVRRRTDDSERRPSRLSLRALMTLGLAIMISAPMFYIARQSVYDAQEKMLSDMRASSARDVQSVQAESLALLQSYERGVRFAATLFASPRHRVADGAAKSSLLASIHEQYPEFQAMAAGDAGGRIVATDPAIDQSGQSSAGIDDSERQFYQNIRSSRSTYFSGVYQAHGLMSGPALAIASPVIDDRGQFAGFVFGRFDTDSFQRIASRYRSDGETLVIADASGLLIADSSMEPNSYQQVAATEDFDLLNRQTSGTLQYSEPGTNRNLSVFEPGNSSLISFSTLPVPGWRVWSKQSLRPLAARLQGFYGDYLAALMAALLLVLAVSKGAASWLTKPITELQESAARLAAGQMFERPPRRRWLTAEHESLYNSFLRMADALEASWNRQQEFLLEAAAAKGELEATFDAMSDAVTITGLDDRLVKANAASHRMWGMEPEQTAGALLTDIVHPNGDWRSCEICVARREGRHGVFLRDPKETPFGKYLEIHVDPIFNAAGERIGAVHVVRDLTEIRQAQTEAEKASALLKDVVDAAYDAVYAANLDGRFLWANKRAADLFGLDAGKVENESYLKSIHTSDLDQVQSAFALARGGQALSFEAQFQSNGGARDVLITNSPIYVDGEVVAVLGIMRDVTEERAAVERAMRSDKLRALGQLAWGVAHNFNNSLTAVLGYTQLVLKKITDPAIRRSLQTVEKAALDAAKMVQRIQNFARQSKDEPSGPVDLNQTMRDALDLTRSLWRDDARAAGITFEVVFHPAEEAVALCDQSAIREMFVNIIINAIEAMPRGGRLDITSLVDGNDLLISFSDTGAGMTEETRLRIFEPFYTTKGAKGQGMGLAVTYGTIERHGGEISVTSEPEQGATFTIRLKRAPEQVTGALDAGGDASPRASSVLVVDDEAPIRVLLSDILRARGHNVQTAEDGLAGLKAIENGRFDMVITDLSMPGADGWTLIKTTRQRWPGTKLVIVTGYGGFAELAVSGGENSNVDALISKPFNIAEIDLTLARLLRG